MKKWSMFLAAAACGAYWPRLQAAERKKMNISFPRRRRPGRCTPRRGHRQFVEYQAWLCERAGAGSNGGIQNLNLLKAGTRRFHSPCRALPMRRSTANAGSRTALQGRRVLAACTITEPGRGPYRQRRGLRWRIQGQKFRAGRAGGTTEVESRIHFTETGLKYPDDIKAHFVGFTESIDLCATSSLTAYGSWPGCPPRAVTEMCSTANGKLVGIGRRADRQGTGEVSVVFQIHHSGGNL